MPLTSYTAVVERATPLAGTFATEPYEVAWAREVLVFIRVREDTQGRPAVQARIQISPDGMHWVDEGTAFAPIEGPGVAFVRVTQFGNWLRVAGQVSPDGAAAKALIYFCLKE